MKFNPSILLAVLVIAITLMNSGSAEYREYTCTNPPINCPGCVPIINCDPTNDIDGCNRQCASTCGLRTSLRSDQIASPDTCDTKCANNVCNGISGSCGLLCDLNKECKNACKSTCELNGQIYSLVDIVYEIAAGIAALMIILHGFKWLISEEPAERKEARERIIYTLYGVIIIIIAVALVNTIYSASISRCAPI